MMARIDVIRFASRSRRNGAISGMPPPTLASNMMSSPRACASASNSGPDFAISSLLAVTTCLPAWMARRMNVPAGSSPPMTSTTMSTNGSSRTSLALVVSKFGGKSTVRGLERSRTAARRTTSDAPTWRAKYSRRSSRARATPPPTTPRPIRPTPISRDPLSVTCVLRCPGVVVAVDVALDGDLRLFRGERVLHQQVPELGLFGIRVGGAGIALFDAEHPEIAGHIDRTEQFGALGLVLDR